jgi:fimbrial isopeptide formation D2 family protein/uncharacterized repeat protein (TIGR01451 family)
VLALVLGLLSTAVVVGSTAAPASAAPGNPGVPGAPRVLFTEDFDNAPNNGNISLTNYVGASGTTYTGDPFWVSRNNCNGFIIDHGSPRNTGDCNGVRDEVFGESAYDALTAIPRAIGLFNELGSAAANQNGAAASYTSGNTADNEVQFETRNPIQLPAANRFVTFSVDAGAENCFASHPELRFYLKNDAGAEFAVSDSAIDPCTDARARTIQSVTQDGRSFDVNVGRFVADGNRLLRGTTLGIVMRNENGNGGGNDGAYDNIRVLDVTPQLDKAFSPQRVPVNGVSTLTLTVTNTSELGAKSGWAFTDNLPDGLVVADDPNLGGTCQATREATPGTGTVEITDGVLAEGARSCTVTVDVTSKSPTGNEPSPVTYRNCAANFSDVVGMDLPSCATVEFFSEAKLGIEKTSDATSGTRVGDVVTYTIRATNVGDADYTNASPAVVGDDLSGVLDDATYNEDARATSGSRPTYDEPRLRWSGPLKVDESVTITYSVTLKAGGDRSVENVAWESCDARDPDCEPDPPEECVDNVDPATGRACDENTVLLPGLVIEKSADTTELPSNGGTVTYTVVATNEGPGAYTQSKPAYVTDDLNEVLDDATLDEGSITADRGAQPTYDAPRISWKGALAAGESVTITYQVTYDARKGGDNDLANVAFGSDTPPPSTTPRCDPAVGGIDPATGLVCDRVEVPGANLQVSKSVDPEKGSTVKAGQELTYTLTFDNDGKAAANVDYTDHLAKVLDDAEVISGPTAQEGKDLTASPIADQEFDVDGTVAPGDTVTVTYTVKVKPDGQRGDDVLGNFLVEGDGTPPPTCAVDDPTCTENPVGEIERKKSVDPSTGTTVQPGETLTYTLTFTNVGEGNAAVETDDDLKHVLDDATVVRQPKASDDSLEVSELKGTRYSITGTVAAGETVTVTYRVRVKDSKDLGDKRLANFLLDPGEDPPSDPTCEEGDTECTSNPVGDLVVTKSVDPKDGSTVKAGQRLTYTLSFRNTGEGAVKVAQVDHMAKALDDATLVSGPTSSDDALTATRAGSTLEIDGELAAGQRVTVTYVLEVKPYARQGDHRLDNFVTREGGTPLTTCQDGDDLCTSNPIEDETSGAGLLPDTGAGFALGAVPIALALLAIGTALTTRRRRDESDTVLE